MTLADLRALLLATPYGWASRGSRGPEYEAAAVFFRRRVVGDVVLYAATPTPKGVRFCYAAQWPPKYLELET
mgnify:FL=1